MEEETAAHSSVLPGESQGRRSLVGCVSGVAQSGHDWSDSAAAAVKSKGFPGGSVLKNPPAVQKTQVRSLGWEDPLQKEMATHSSILVWRIL